MNKRRLLNFLVTQEKPDVFPILAREPRQQNQISRNRIRRFAVASVLVALPFGAAVFVHAQRFGMQEHEASDPGVREGTIDAGKPIASLTTAQSDFFNHGQDQFTEIESVSGGTSLPNEPGNGLGPAFNSNSCGSCHSQPAVGGTSPRLDQFPHVGKNPEILAASDAGATNKIPFFITDDGPVREARFPFLVNPNGTQSRTPDGGVHDLFTIAGRSDAPGCKMAQPNFEEMHDLNNLIFRIPTPMFGAGLIENIADSTILDNMHSNAELKRGLGISGHPNTSGNDGTITRFGWKAQNKSLEIFAGEAYNVEMGVTSDGFPNERGNPPASCLLNATPETSTNFDPGKEGPAGVVSDVASFAIFMRFLAPPTPSMDGIPGKPTTTSINRGGAIFDQVLHCSMCHTPMLKTARSNVTGLSEQNAGLFSDLLVHHMGSRLADNVTQGDAGPDEFRTAPLWGVGQRIFFLHDGRTSDLRKAIEDHASSGSDANQVIQLFHKLSEPQKQDLLNFLRSL